MRIIYLIKIFIGLIGFVLLTNESDNSLINILGILIIIGASWPESKNIILTLINIK